jgi:hypothetical protein
VLQICNELKKTMAYVTALPPTTPSRKYYTESCRGICAPLNRGLVMASDPGHSRTSRLAYVRAIKSEAAAYWYQAIPLLKRDRCVFGLHTDDGTLVAIADSREAAVAGAASFQLQALSLH